MPAELNVKTLVPGLMIGSRVEHQGKDYIITSINGSWDTKTEKDEFSLRASRIFKNKAGDWESEAITLTHVNQVRMLKQKLRWFLISDCEVFAYNEVQAAYMWGQGEYDYMSLTEMGEESSYHQNITVNMRDSEEKVTMTIGEFIDTHHHPCIVTPE